MPVTKIIGHLKDFKDNVLIVLSNRFSEAEDALFSEISPPIPEKPTLGDMTVLQQATSRVVAMIHANEANGAINLLAFKKSLFKIMESEALKSPMGIIVPEYLGCWYEKEAWPSCLCVVSKLSDDLEKDVIIAVRPPNE